VSASNAFENALLALYFNNTAHANIGDAAGLLPSATAGVYWVSLHTADPGEAGTQATSEATYTSYARASIVRTVAGFSFSAGVASNLISIIFPTSTGGSNIITHFGLGSANAGAGNLFLSGVLTASATIVSGQAPFFAVSSLTVTCD
jgi:hypothetical protein